MEIAFKTKCYKCCSAFCRAYHSLR